MTVGASMYNYCINQKENIKIYHSKHMITTVKTNHHQNKVKKVKVIQLEDVPSSVILLH